MTAAIPIVTGKHFPTASPLPAYAAIPERTVWTFVAIVAADSPEDLEAAVCAQLHAIEATPGGCVVLPIVYEMAVRNSDYPLERLSVLITYRAPARIEP